MVSMIVAGDVSEIYYRGLSTGQSRPFQEGKQGIVWTYAGALVIEVEGHSCRFLRCKPITGTLRQGRALVMTSRSTRCSSTPIKVYGVGEITEHSSLPFV
jgi:hypothetical protein